jgi:hypothetical protein
MRIGRRSLERACSYTPSNESHDSCHEKMICHSFHFVTSRCLVPYTIVALPLQITDFHPYLHQGGKQVHLLCGARRTEFPRLQAQASWADSC